MKRLQSVFGWITVVGIGLLIVGAAGLIPPALTWFAVRLIVGGGIGWLVCLFSPEPAGRKGPPQ